MKTLLLLPMLCSLSLSARAQAEVTLEFLNLDRKSGKLYVGWFASSADFLQGKNQVYGKIQGVSGQESTSISFKDVRPGRYAIAAFLDENGNGRLDRNRLGIPKERYGFSNNPSARMRPATFGEAAIQLQQSRTISIRLR